MSKRILVQPDGRQIIRDMLAGTDYEITEAENGEEALAAIAKQRSRPVWIASFNFSWDTNGSR
jgi:CheY-like chemotaxis protein